VASVLTGFISFRETPDRGRGKERTNLSWFIKFTTAPLVTGCPFSGAQESCTGSPCVPGCPIRSSWWAYSGICLAHPGTDCLFRLS